MVINLFTKRNYSTCSLLESNTIVSSDSHYGTVAIFHGDLLDANRTDATFRFTLRGDDETLLAEHLRAKGSNSSSLRSDACPQPEESGKLSFIDNLTML